MLLRLIEQALPLTLRADAELRVLVEGVPPHHEELRTHRRLLLEHLLLALALARARGAEGGDGFVVDEDAEAGGEQFRGARRRVRALEEVGDGGVRRELLDGEGGGITREGDDVHRRVPAGAVGAAVGRGGGGHRLAAHRHAPDAAKVAHGAVRRVLRELTAFCGGHRGRRRRARGDKAVLRTCVAIRVHLHHVGELRLERQHVPRPRDLLLDVRVGRLPALLLALLVAPVRREAVLRHLVHLHRADLHLEGAPHLVRDDGVERAVRVRLGFVDVILQPALHRRPQRVERLERLVALLLRLDDDAKGAHVVHLLERKLLALHLLVNAVQALWAPSDIHGAHARAVEGALARRDAALELLRVGG
mmetsp:Transcript_25125/g.82399  ORF Transcript_25125/g.82399 Transcript_25125/m.82399 type:complete len:363 (-) Transcript_25125:1169-2257(-)